MPEQGSYGHFPTNDGDGGSGGDGGTGTSGEDEVFGAAMMEVLAPFGSGGHVDEVLGASGNDRGWRYWLWKMVVAAGGGGDRIIAWQTVVVE